MPWSAATIHRTMMWTLGFGLATCLGGCDFTIIVPLCGGTDGIGCPPGLYCRYSDGCGGDHETGVCRTRPDFCLAVYDPVCGCDGRTYVNECGAAMAGVNVARRGSCDGGGEFCGGIAGFTCPAGQFCRFDGGTCGSGDQGGVCQRLPEACPLVFAPVCGCDGRTYGNECEAWAAGVSAARNGSCEVNGLGPACGSTNCEPGDFCMTPDGDCENEAAGVCTRVPDVCAAVVDPVCGCDGKTYLNDCAAFQSRTSVAGEGACPTP